MSKALARAAAAADLATHPAVTAWLETSPGSLVTDVVMLKAHMKSNVFRLFDKAAEGGTLIAKWSTSETFEIETTVYREVVPTCGITGPRYLGSTPSQHEGGSWLFMTDLGGSRYMKGRAAHLRAATRWVAALHLATCDEQRWPELPDRSHVYFYSVLTRANDLLARLVAMRSLDSEVEITLHSIAACLREAIGRYDEIAAIATSAPQVLVHGDLVEKNVLVATGSGAEVEIAPVDWEFCGYGCPALDVSRVDAAGYWNLVRAKWPHVDADDVRRMSAIGRIFRIGWAVNWASSWGFHDDSFLNSESVHKYERWIRRAIGDLSERRGAGG